jgi:hypothetical protein
MIEELKSIEENGTWHLTELSSSQRPICLKWVFKLKKDAAGNVVKHKARLVMKGYVQRQEVDFEEVFTPMAVLNHFASSSLLLRIMGGQSITWTLSPHFSMANSMKKSM